MPSYTVREWDKIAHGEGEGEILLRHADKLASLAARSIFAGRGGSGVLEHGRNALRARGVVGILATSEVSLEILPKIEVAPAETFDRQNAEIRKRLVHMLAVALDLRIDLGKVRSEEHTSELQSLMRTSYAVFCLQPKITIPTCT